MPTFVYRAKTGPSQVINGSIIADNNQEAVAKILQMGQTPLEVKLQTLQMPVKTSVLSDSFHEDELRVPPATVAIFTRQMFDMVDAGVPLLRCLDVLAGQRQDPVMLQVIISMRDFVQGGGSFSAALAMHPKTFSPLYINMVKSGELGGFLPLVLSRLADFIDKDLQIRNQVKSSLLYPAIIFLVGLLTMFVLLTFVLPRLTVMFDDFNAALPIPTQIVIAVSNFFASFWYLILGLVVAGGFFFQRWMITPAGTSAIDNFILKIPILKDFIKGAEMARFARTLGTLLESGVTISSALESVKDVTGSSVFKEQLISVAQKVKSGSSLTGAIKGNDFFPEVATNLIAVAEESGRLEKGLYKLATMAERSTASTAATFVTILGPAVLVMVVGVIGFVIISMLLPMFRMNMIIN